MLQNFHRYVGLALRTHFGLRVGRITGLDPAEPHFEHTPMEVSRGSLRGGKGVPGPSRETKRSAFSTNAHSRYAMVVLDGVLMVSCIARHTRWCPCTSEVPEAMHEASQGPLKGVVSAQKAFLGSETETRKLLGV